MQGGIARDITSADDLDHLWSIAAGYFEQAGFTEIAYILLQRGQPELPMAVFHNGNTEDIHGVYMDVGYAQHDPAARYALQTGKPFDVADLPRLTAFTRQEAETFRALQEAGARHVLILPVFGPGAANGLFALDATGCPELLTWVSAEELQAAGQLIHLRSLALLPEVTRVLPNPLSERELEILRWVAVGKSNAVIAKILEISSGTVDTYLRRIFEKLDVSDRTAAAVRGVSYGIIRG